MAASNGSEYFELDVESEVENTFSRPSNAEFVAEDEEELRWAAIERLPSQQRSNFALVRRTASRSDGGEESTDTIDVRKLDRFNRELVVRRALATTAQDNFQLLSGIKERFDKVGLEIAKVEVRFENVQITADVKIGSGKSTLLRALAGKLESSLKKSGTITYNGHEFDDFFVQRASAYIGQTDNHIAELTVRETLDFAARCQGEGFSGVLGVKYTKTKSYSDSSNEGSAVEAVLLHVWRLKPPPGSMCEITNKASSIGGKRHSVSTDYILKVLGLDVCSDTLVDSLPNSGTGEMVVGPRKTLFMDEISTGLDSSTTFQIVNCIRNFVHLMEGTVLMALLQPAPETFDLFDDLILLSEGYLLYHGPRSEVLQFFESLGFDCHLVTSRKDQAQYWGDHSKPYQFVPVSKIAEAFRNSRYGQNLESFLSDPYDKSKNHPSALPRTKNYIVYNLSQMSLNVEEKHVFTMSGRNMKLTDTGKFHPTRLHPTDVTNGELYLSCLFFGLVHMMFNGFSELPLMIFRLPVFYKQRDNLFHPAWAWSFASFILRVPYSVIEAVVWSCVVYYTVGFAPGAGRFFRFMFLLFSVHQMALGLFRTMASIARDMIIANTFGSAALLIIFLLGGFIVPKEMIKPWWVWAFWVSPLSYGQRAISVNEFTATRWMERLTVGNSTLGNQILQLHSLPNNGYWYWLGVGVLLAYALFFNITVTMALAFLNRSTHWLISWMAMSDFNDFDRIEGRFPLFALTAIQKSQTIVPSDDEKENGQAENCRSNTISGNDGMKKKGMILPFQPLTMTFHNVNYFVDMPKEMSSQGIPETRLQLLYSVSGVFSPGVLTALMGSSGAGKTTLMDVLAGRKTSGYIEGDVRISGYPKEQKSFARISGYVEQSDIHSPQVTVIESLWFSSFLRLPEEVNEGQRKEFVEEVMQLVELDTLRHALVGLPGSSGLSTEQRKRLTIAVELVANPSIIFMDEPTSGLDARAAAIVMRTVRNTVDTGRTVVCTIHQPSIEIFEAFDELLLMKRGGRVIYGGKLGERSQTMINYFQVKLSLSSSNLAVEYFCIRPSLYGIREMFSLASNIPNHFAILPFIAQSISGVPPIADGYNPATWMLEVSTPAMEEKIHGDFAVIYQNSQQYRLRDSTQNLFVVLGALYASVMFLGVNNSSSVQPVISIERTVFYREKAAGMYSPFPFAFAQGLVEIPYILVQTIIYGIITYFMINFERTVGKFFLYLLFMFLTFTYFTFYGMMVVGLTPTQNLAAVVSSAFYSLWNLLSGFLVPKPLGDVETRIVGPGFEGTVKDYINFRFGYDSGMLGVSVAVLIGFSILFFGVFAISVRLLNFQRR
ncbi:hypothetical protein DH2020_022090 [Rehmannia glutinosa]|uniref:ABC transporter domain-containing protein n=1 Tax=Rehmannia glutinosa TaxID=99300 RepID=A0ABR0WGI3_REHGL